MSYGQGYQPSFRLTYGVVPPEHRLGGISKAFQPGFNVEALQGSHYNHRILCTVSAEGIYPTVVACSELLSSPCMAVLEVYDSTRVNAMTGYASTAFPRERVLEVFGRYAFQLVHDGFTAFGLASEAFEVFVDQHKYLRIYTKELPEVVRVLGSLGVPEVEGLTIPGTGKHYHVPIGAVFNSSFSRYAEPPPEEEVRKNREGRGAYEGFSQAIIRDLEMGVQRRVQGKSPAPKA